MMLISHTTTIPSPVGPLRLGANGAGLCLIQFARERRPRAIDPDAQALPSAGDHAVLAEAQRQLDAYFAGQLQHFDLPLALQGTAFQCQTWRALAGIPFGQTVSYAQLAERVGRPSAVRAVGAANGRNPLPIVLPCHRVIGANGSLTGFAGGLEAKAYLLRLESRPAVNGQALLWG